MEDQDKSYAMRIYLDDLVDLMAEHDKPDYPCPDCANRRKSGGTGPCSYEATISVEIVTTRRKLS